MNNSLAAALVCALVLVACAGTPARMEGGALTGATGMTLYTFDRASTAGDKSVCNGPCAANWPPMMAADGARLAGEYTIIARDDGRKPWALKGKPLYYWAKDRKPGDRTGDGVNNIWHVARE